MSGALALAGCGSSGGAGGPDGVDSGAGSPDADDGLTVTLTMDDFPVPAGGEVYKCQNFANPFGGAVEVSGFESHMTEGSHHMLLFYAGDGTDGALEDCSGLEFHPTPYGAQTPNSVVSYPEGIAAYIPAGQPLRIQSHYLNATDQDVMAHVTMTFHLAKEGTVTAHAGMVFLNNANIVLPPDASPQDVTKSCAMPRDIHLIVANSHMHKHGVEFNAQTDGGTSIYHTTNWDDPPLKNLSPTIDMKAGDKIQWTCSYINDTNGYLTFGESASNNEMCIFTGQYYPAPDTDPMIGC